MEPSSILYILFGVFLGVLTGVIVTEFDAPPRDSWDNSEVPPEMRGLSVDELAVLYTYAQLDAVWTATQWQRCFDAKRQRYASDAIERLRSAVDDA